MVEKDPESPMICVGCGNNVTSLADDCPACRESPLLDGRYALESVVGRGANGTTYRARRISDGQTVAIKELLIRKVESLKALELFERESRVLEQLEHEGIPRFHDELALESGRSVSLFLVQDFIDGETLATEFERRRATPEEVFGIAADLLDTLSYLHSLSPPVIHRDIKPANIMRRASDGQLLLIDFGSVRDAVDSDEGGSTVTGTFGYMAPEQFMGRAIPATDIYGLGATIVALLAKEDPQKLSGFDRTIDWEAHIELPDALATILTSMLEADPERRASDAPRLATTIRAALTGEHPAPAPESMGDSLAPIQEPLPEVRAGLAAVPPAPRPVPEDFAQTYAANASLGKSIWVMFGAIAFYLACTAVGFALFASDVTVVPILTGALAALLGAVAARGRWRSFAATRRRQLALRDGVPAIAKIRGFSESAYRIDSRSATVYYFDFEVDGRAYSGEHHIWDPVDLRSRDEVVVLYRPSDPAAAVIYDPRRFGSSRASGSRPDRRIDRDVVSEGERALSAGPAEKLSPVRAAEQSKQHAKQT